MNYLGLQDASRKRRHTSLHPGAWIGCLLHYGDVYPVKLVTQDKWDWVGDGLQWIAKCAAKGDTLNTWEL